MLKVLESLGLIALAVGYAFYRLFVLLKIYALTIMPLGGPQLGMWKMWMVTVFLHCVAYSHKKDNRTVEELTKALLASSVGLSIGWGLTYLIFG